VLFLSHLVFNGDVHGHTESTVTRASPRARDISSLWLVILGFDALPFMLVALGFPWCVCLFVSSPTLQPPFSPYVFVGVYVRALVRV